MTLFHAAHKRLLFLSPLLCLRGTILLCLKTEMSAFSGVASWSCYTALVTSYITRGSADRRESTKHRLTLDCPKHGDIDSHMVQFADDSIVLGGVTAKYQEVLRGHIVLTFYHTNS